MRALIALALMLAIGGAGCGKRGDPLPPLLRIPTPVNRPHVSQQGQDIVIVWETPTGTVDGGALELTEAEVLRRVVEPSPEPPPDAPTALPFEAGEETTLGEVDPADPSVVGEPPPNEMSDATVAPDEAPPEEPGEGESTEEGVGDAEEGVGDAEPVVPRLTVAPPQPASLANEPKVIARIECHDPGERLEYRDSWGPEWEGMRVEYAVRHVNSKGRRSENSNWSSIEPLPPLPAPSGLAAVAGNGLVRLTWGSEPEAERPEPGVEPNEEIQTETEPETKTHEEKLDFGYNVYRKRGAAEYYPARALNRRLLETTGFEDRDVAFGRDWCYTVRRAAVGRTPEPTELGDELAPDESAAVSGGSAPPAEGTPPENIQGRTGQASGEGGRPAPQPPAAPVLIESAGAEEACLTPVDTFAPAAPEDLVALGVPGGILLSWSESNASDVEGYRVYRADQRDGPFELLTLEPVDVPSFTDRDASSGRPYFYAVSAVDGAQPPNESPRSAVVDAQARE